MKGKGMIKERISIRRAVSSSKHKSCDRKTPLTEIPGEALWIQGWVLVHMHMSNQSAQEEGDGSPLTQKDCSCYWHVPSVP